MTQAKAEEPSRGRSLEYTAVIYCNASKCRVVLAAMVLAIAMGTHALAADPQLDNPSPPSKSPSTAKNPEARNFYDVLDDVLGDFEYDLKNGNVTGLKDLAIKNIAVSENIPPSFKSHLELLITEKILKNTRARVIECLSCRAKRATLNGDQVVISSPETNPVELSRIAKVSGIQSFMDIAFSYEPTGIVLSMYITEPESGSVIWSRSYNSETSRAEAQRRGVDFSQIDNARRETEYTATVQYRPIVYYLFEPNIGGQTGTLGFGFRAMERYDNRKKEVGFELNYLMDSGSMGGEKNPPGTPPNIFAGFNLTLLFMHAWNLIGEEENFNKVRGNIFVGVGGTYASGFLGGLVRGGYEWRLGKHFATSVDLGFRPSGTVIVGGASAGSISGVEYGLGISLLF